MSAKIFTEVRRRELALTAQSQWVLAGGGIKRAYATGEISWTNRFIAISIAKGKRFSTTAHINIFMPTEGTFIPNVSGGSDVRVSNSRILMPSWSSLWYIPTRGAGEDTVNSNFRITTYNYGTTWEVPEHWILIATLNHDGQSFVKWGDGDITDFWRPAPLINGWVNYGDVYCGAEYVMIGGNRVFIRGLVKNGTNAVIFILPAGYRPSGNLIFATQTDPQTIGRLEINAVDGWVMMGAGSAGWFSICCNFIADQ